ncbi:PTS mannitol transporter subunit IICB [Anaerocolumna xylanovorans]|uniref:PTS system mannitol-specific EIICB component n=1 Tax=Anaerocolumna xylanovorans DSM 12503 TaxID=1121345 RepID=A0A1M7YGW9_9FIRM|nr:PTS mannitol transporter subunit IICBA [Anaerocolumna xylanovorans]SHO51809.1 PTS system, mannitol-specific IIC component [Anaerocolumna xylanovorans DSM 12503]
MKEKVQSFGRALSSMVMPNIGAFIAWGLITALFIPTGWAPNEKLAELVGPMSTYLLPLLIAYTGGKNVAGVRGGVMGAIATMGVIVGADVPMFLGAMIMGPLAGYIIKKFDKLIEGKVIAGFEMLVNNFSIGILGGILALIGFLGISPVVAGLNTFMEAGVGFFVNHGILPLVSLFIEPAKILFLNNAVNHGILSPMGMQQASETGKSIFFLLEANPGPGLGILLAYCIAGKGNARSSAPGAIIIHFLGGIHEIYFPYILMNPILILAAMAGGASGVFTLSLFKAGLVGPASPGSIIAVLGMTAKDSYLGVILSVVIACAVSCLVALPLLKAFGKEEDLEAAQKMMKEMKNASKGIVDTVAIKGVKNIVFACDAGMGSSAMGATILRKKLAAAGLDSIKVVHASVSSIPEDAQVVVTHEELRDRAAHSCPNARLVLIKNFMAAPEYDLLVEELKA